MSHSRFAYLLSTLVRPPWRHVEDSDGEIRNSSYIKEFPPRETIFLVWIKVDLLLLEVVAD